MRNQLIVPFVIACLTTLPYNLNADTDSPSTDLSRQWAEIAYEAPQKEAKNSLKSLYKEARLLVTTHQGNEEVLAWAGIITASYAGAKGGLGALKLAKEARSFLEAAIEINPEVLQGGARTSLGVLYYQVPPWPVGFGNVKRAEKLLVESYQKHPSNIDVLYFYGDFLHNQKRTKEARDILQRAQAVPIREHRRSADAGRQRQIAEKLAVIDANT